MFCQVVSIFCYIIMICCVTVTEVGYKIFKFCLSTKNSVVEFFFVFFCVHFFLWLSLLRLDNKNVKINFKIKQNEEIKNLMQILGLQHQKVCEFEIIFGFFPPPFQLNIFPLLKLTPKKKKPPQKRSTKQPPV